MSEESNYLKVWPVLGVFGPALKHQLEDVPGAVVGLAQQFWQRPSLTEVGQVLHHFFITESLVGQLPGEGEDLPERHPEGPDVAAPGVLLAQQGLPAQPSDGQSGRAVVVRTVGGLDCSSVGYLDLETSGDLAVPAAVRSGQSGLL